MSKKQKGPKILILDIETSLMDVRTFGLFGNDFISYKRIINDWNITCAAWKWLGEKRVYAASTLEGKNLKDDSVVIKKLCAAMDKADLIIAHNGDKFDIKKINTRRLKHNLGPGPKPRTIDTLKVAKREFSFTSNRLDYLAGFLGLKGKLETSDSLWDKVASGQKSSIREMLKYNKQDVLVLEEVYLKLRSYITNHPNVKTYITDDKDELLCTNCGSENLIKNGFRHTNSGKYQRYACNDCGASNTIDARNLIKKGG